MKYVLQKGPLGSLRFSPPSEALPARLLRSLALSTLPSPCARGPGPAPCSIGLLPVRSCSMSPREARCEAASAALLASRLARPPVSALRASHPWLLLDAFRRTPLRPLQKLLGLGVLAHRRCRCAPALAFRPPPPSLLSSRSCLFTNCRIFDASIFDASRRKK
jgi:hypothetical protein